MLKPMSMPRYPELARGCELDSQWRSIAHVKKLSKIEILLEKEITYKSQGADSGCGGKLWTNRGSELLLI